MGGCPGLFAAFPVYHASWFRSACRWLGLQRLQLVHTRHLDLHVGHDDSVAELEAHVVHGIRGRDIEHERRRAVAVAMIVGEDLAVHLAVLRLQLSAQLRGEVLPRHAPWDIDLHFGAVVLNRSREDIGIAYGAASAPCVRHHWAA